MIKKIIILLLAVSFTGVVKAQFKSEHDPILTKSLSSESIKKVFLNTSGGSIMVAGISSGEPRLEVYASPNGKNIFSSKEDIHKILDEKYELSITVTNNELHATAKPKNKFFNFNNQLSISFKVYVPQNVSTDLHTSGGSISLSDLNGDEKFSTSGGSLHLENLQGNINGSTSGGSIHAKNSSGQISLSTSGGSIGLDGLKGTIDVNTSGGSIGGNNIEGSLKANTSGGSVNLQDMACSLNASTSGGSMHVTMTALGKYVTLDDSGGNIYLSIPEGRGLNLKLRAPKIDVDRLNNFSGSKKEDEITGTLNGGGIPVNAGTSGGKITLVFK
jgi:hypothetical protein